MRGHSLTHTGDYRHNQDHMHAQDHIHGQDGSQRGGGDRPRVQLPTSSRNPNIDHALKFIELLQSNPRLFESNLDPNVLYRLQNPPTAVAELTPDERESINSFLAATDSSRQIYYDMRAAALRSYPADKIVSHHLAKKRVTELSSHHPRHVS